jgi:hypothetical protein
MQLHGLIGKSALDIRYPEENLASLEEKPCMSTPKVTKNLNLGSHMIEFIIKFVAVKKSNMEQTYKVHCYEYRFL